jgi:DNA gyrase inhibitor GyrI/ribosomal protein S18 acetylase RimI-like enzyme
VAPWLADHGLIDCPRYGVSLDDPRTTAPEACRYDACVELPPGLTLPDAPETRIAGGRYAVTVFKGAGSGIGAAWSEFQRAFEADPELRLDGSRPPFEYYPRGTWYDARTGAFSCELCLPVRAVQASLQIERAVEADAPAILELQKRAYESEARLYGDWTLPPLTQTLQSLREELAHCIALKAVEAGRIVGAVRARESAGTCQVARLIVEPARQGQGIGTRLMHAIEAAFPEARRFELFTGSRSGANLRLYERLGYSRFREQTLSPAVTLVYLEKPRREPS